jgi:SAM-dependent methyltransferase
MLGAADMAVRRPEIATPMEMERLIEALGQDRKTADAAGVALLDRGESVLPRLLAAWKEARPEVRRRLAFLLGKVAPRRPHPERQRALLEALTDPDRKVRRNAAVSLGRLGDDSLSSPLRQALSREADPAVRASLTLAIGRFATVSDLPWLKTLQPTSEEERRAARTVTARLSAEARGAPAADGALPIAAQAHPELWCRRGLASVVAAEARDRGLSVRPLSTDRVAVGGMPSFASLFTVRTALHPALVCDLPAPPGDPGQAGRLFARSAVADQMRRLSHGEVPTYRLTLSGPVAGFHRRRPWIDAFAAAAAGLENGATGYSWEVVARPHLRGLLLGARPATVSDPRFWYRERDIPAAIHPTLAAAAAHLLPAGDGDLVVDPFCGSGTLLAERALAGRYARLVGIDHLVSALSAAQVNLSRVAPGTELLRGDFSGLERFAPIDAILTNPPYGRRISDRASAGDLHARLDALATRVLRPGGYLVVFRPIELPRPASLRIVNRLEIDAGGLAVNLWVAQRRGT